MALLGNQGLGIRVVRDVTCEGGWRPSQEFRKTPLLPQPPLEDSGDVKGQLLAVDEDDEDPFDVSVKVDGEEVWIEIDPEKGPRWGLRDEDWVQFKDLQGVNWREKKWKDLNIHEKELCLLHVAKKMKIIYTRMGKSLERAERKVEDLGPQKSAEEVAAEVRSRIELRCKMEFTRPVVQWKNIEIEDVTESHNKRSKGILYNLEFPFTETMFANMGADWVTEAFHKAGTMDRDNKVVKIIMEKKIKITTGNNGGKFLFEVRYKRPDPSLHTKLFAKIPFPLEGVTRSDRLSSSVNKQPNDFYELNANRLLEATLPCKIPRFYYGDISNETTNYILITERVAFSDRASQNYGRPKPRKGPLRPFMIEGPYDKCLDYNLRGDPKYYYICLLRVGAKMAGHYKAGKLGDQTVLAQSFLNMENKPMESWGMVFSHNSGEDPRMLKTKIDNGITFISDVGKVLYPSYCQDEAWLERLRNLILTVNAYANELQCWKHAHPDYIALAHQNLNVDNAYFWRDTKNKLECGILDWGGMGSTCLGHKLWWWLYCQDFEPLQANLTTYIEVFIEAFHKHGGALLEVERLRKQIIISAIQQLVQLFAAVPQITKMCPKKEWPTIDDRYDERISTNVDGKSTLRLYLHVINNVVRMLEEMGGFEVISSWITDNWQGEFKIPPKTWEAITSPPLGTRL